MLGQFYFCISLLTVCRIYILYFTVAVEVEETSFEFVSLIALHEVSASRRKMILLSSPSEPERPTAATADDHFVMFHTQKMNELVGSAACPHCNTSALHVTDTNTKGYAVQLHLTCEHCDAELSSVYSSPKLPTSDNPTRQPFIKKMCSTCYTTCIYSLYEPTI